MYYDHIIQSQKFCTVTTRAIRSKKKAGAVSLLLVTVPPDLYISLIAPVFFTHRLLRSLFLRAYMGGPTIVAALNQFVGLAYSVHDISRGQRLYYFRNIFAI